jgi:hypothetical protein
VRFFVTKRKRALLLLSGFFPFALSKNNLLPFQTEGQPHTFGARSYKNGIRSGVRVPPGIHEDTLGVRKIKKK